MPRRERSRDHQRIRLRQIDKRVGNFGLRAVEFVVAQGLIARGVHAEHEQASFVGERRLRDHFDDGLGNLHSRRRTDSIQHAFGKARFSGGHFERGLSRHFLDGFCERVEQGGVGGANGEEDGHAERDAERGERHAQPVHAPLPLTDHPEGAEHQDSPGRPGAALCS